MVLPTLRGREWMPSFRFKMIRSIEFLVFHVLCEFCSFYAPSTFSHCCALPFDEATHYGAPHTPSKGMDAFVSFQNDPRYRVHCISRFVLVLLILRSEDLLTLFFTSFRLAHTLWFSLHFEEGNGCLRFVSK